MTHDEMIAIIQAHKEGKIIEMKDNTNENPDWYVIKYDTFDFVHCDYRIKPEPKSQPKFEIGDIINCFYETAIITDKRFNDGVWQYLIEDTTWVTENELVKHNSKEVEPHYRPFKSAEEMMEAIKEHGDWICLNKNSYKITSVLSHNYITYGNNGGYTVESLFDEHFTFADGTPFGIKEE